MSFNIPAYLWLCLLFLIPWIIYLLQFFLAKSQVLPSLIFLKEDANKKKSPRKRLLVYLLQSIVLLIPGLLLAGPFFGGEGQQYFCIVDDLVRSQFTKSQYDQVQSELRGSCRDNFYSLASLSQNRIEKVNQDNLARNENVNLQDILLRFSEKLKGFQILYIAAEKSYEERMNEYSDNSIVVKTKPLFDKKNFYFRKVMLSPHLTDFRKRELFIWANPEAKGQQILIHKGGNQIAAILNDEAKYFTTIDVDFSKPRQEVRVVLQGDSYFKDNQATLLVFPKKPYELKYSSSEIPKSIRAILELSPKSFPYAWFKKGPGLSLGFNLRQQSRNISFTKNSTSSGSRYLKTKWYFGGDVFRKNYVQKTYGNDFFSVSGNVIERFSDGLPAVIKYQQTTGGVFFFDPDSAEDTLLRHPQYPLYLISAMLSLLDNNNVKTLYTESERDVALPKLKGSPFSPEVHAKNKEYYTLQWHSGASYLTGKSYPQEMLYDDISSGSSSRNIRKLLLGFFFALIAIIFWLEYPLSYGEP